ncbi:HWE histidine kinase domain-containing protein [Hyphomicrobium sp.]|uniref:HWE histidine kinase domain-containing protein n=1 Tax=Hyphomicrobium sp. TaxID=82 RepID=UPI000FA848EA|nr:HWE histidine kinase domain-containing protein [Hyphomicrobium sp.]RUO99646.1 MAG: histidine kinase [Hyphomicrobium sp.]
MKFIVNNIQQFLAGIFALAANPGASARRAAYFLCLGILIPSLSFAAYLLNEMHARELGILHQSVQGRALVAASVFDEQMSSLLRIIKALPGTPATATENTYDRLRSELEARGIVLFTRGANLDLLSPANGANAAVVSVDTAARSAAAAALTTLVPQITRYGATADGGINIWLASASKSDPPYLVQAQVPSSYLASTFKNFVADGPWSISIVGADGQVYAEADGKQLTPRKSEVSGNPALIEAFANTSQFGWRITAGIPSRSLDQNIRRNWMTFLAISSLLAIASFTGATLLTRSIIERDSNQLTQSGMPTPYDPPEPSLRRPSSTEMGEDRIRTALSAGSVGVWQWNLQSGLVSVDAEVAAFLGPSWSGKDQVARELLHLIDPHDRPKLLDAIRRTISAGKPLGIEFRVRRSEHDIRWIAVRGAAIGPKGKIASRGARATLLSGVAYDVTDQKVNLTRTDALLREVSHRSKNLLALILAMARLTARDAADVKSHLKDFTLRVAGLSASQDLIVASDWQSVDLATLALAEIGAVARTSADRVAVSGPPVSLTPEAAQTFGMVLTELALNAVEHGALSAAMGEVRLSWEFPTDETICISWIETGGPPYVADGPKGYGTSVVERFSSQGLKLAVQASSDVDGLKWTLSGPLANIGARRERA